MSGAFLDIDIPPGDIIGGASALDKLVAAADRTASSVDRLVTSFDRRALPATRKFREEADRVTASASRMTNSFQTAGAAGGLQNVSYQIQDIAVQVGAGTSAFQAFGQQLPQLLSGFGLVGIVAGTAAAALLPIAGYLFNLGDEAESVADRMESLATASDDARAAISMQGASVEEITEKYGRADQQIRDLIDSLAQLRIDEAIDKARELRSSFEDWTSTDVSWNRFSDMNEGVIALAQEFKITRDEAEGLQAAMIAFEGAQSIAEMADAAHLVADAIAETRDESGRLNPELKDINSEVVNIVDSLEQARASVGAVASGTLDAASAASTAAGSFRDMADAASAAATASLQAAEARDRYESLKEIRTARSENISRLDATEDSRGQQAIDADGARYRAAEAALKRQKDYQAELRKAASGGGGGGGGGGGISDAERAAKRIEDNITRIKRQSWKDYYSDIADMREDERERIEEVNSYVANSFADMFAGAISGATSLKDSVIDLAAELGKMALTQGFQGLVNGFGGSAGGNLLTSLFGIGSRAGGGQVHAGKPYEVGERGKELWVPQQSGTIIPTGQYGGTSVYANFAPTLSAPGADAGAIARLQQQLNEMQRNFKAEVAAAVSKPRAR